VLKSVGAVAQSVSVQSGSFSVLMTGFAALTTTWAWRLIGGVLIELRVTAAGTGVSNATNYEMPAGTLPQILRPDLALTVPVPLFDNNTYRVGRVDIPSIGAGAEGGLLFATPDDTGAMNAAGFTASGLKGLALGTPIYYWKN
jgi:hypothetical protein